MRLAAPAYHTPLGRRLLHFGVLPCCKRDRPRTTLPRLQMASQACIQQQPQHHYQRAPGHTAALKPSTTPNPAALLNPGPSPPSVLCLPAPGAITATVVCPLDVLKTRLQVQGKAGAAMYRGVGGEYLIKALHPPPNPAPAAAACQLGAASGAARLAAASQYSYEAVAQGEHPAPEP